MTFPSLIMATEPQSSETSDRMWVLIRRLLSRFLRAASDCLISIIPLGSSPDVGSSRMMMSGLGRRAWARTTLCLMPLEKPPTFLSRHSHILTVSNASLARMAVSRESSPYMRATYCMISAGVKPG